MKRGLKVWYERLIEWRVGHVRERDFIIILSLLVGIASGFAAIIMRYAVRFLFNYISGVVGEGTSILYFIMPLVGIFLTALFVRFVIRDDISHGVTQILYAISQKSSVIRSHNIYSSMIGSTLTIGFGGSVGSEATIVLTGGALGSNLARLFRMNYKAMTLMIGCGASAAIAGIFKAPIAGIVFTLEVLMLDMTMASLLPLMISAMTSYVLVFFMMGSGNFLAINTESLAELQNTFDFVDVLFYITLGLFCGLISVYFIRVNIWVERLLKSLKNFWVRILIGGSLLGLVIAFFPAFYGEGYETLRMVLENGFANSESLLLSHSIFHNLSSSLLLMLLYTLGLVLVKVVATALTNGSGGVGGVFAPCLFTGGMCGLFFVLLVTIFYPGVVPVSFFVLAGMAGVMSGVMSAPMTAIFLIAEMTGSYFLLIPLMITSIVSYLASRGMEPHSIYARRLARLGELITHNKDKAVLTLMRLDNVIETDFQIIRTGYTLGTLVKKISRAHRNIFPVVSRKGALVGVVVLDDVRKVMFQQELYDKLTVRDFMTIPPATIDIDDTMEQVMKKFEESGAWNLPVICDGKYEGFVSKARIYSSYREVLQVYSDD